MVLYSIVPPEQVMQQPDTTAYQYRHSHNSFIQGVEIDGKFTVSRLISTNPRLYLDPRFAPGSRYPEK